MLAQTLFKQTMLTKRMQSTGCLFKSVILLCKWTKHSSDSESKLTILALIALKAT